MTKKTYAPAMILLLSVIYPTSIASAQTSWWRTYGGTNNDWGLSVQQTADSGYIIAGSTESFGAGSYDVYLLKADASGDTLWTRTYGGPYDDRGYSVQQTSDGGYVIAGTTLSFGAGSEDVYLIKTSASGDTQWTSTYGGISIDAGCSIQQIRDSGFVIVGFSGSFGGGNADVYLIRTDASGDTLWTRTYGGASGDEGLSVQQTTDGGYIIAGNTLSSGAGNADFYLIKISAAGDTLWTRTCGGTDDDWGRSVQQTSDGGYVIAGQTASFGAGEYDVCLIKTDASGDTEWTRTFGGTDGDRGYSVQQTSDRGYIIAGYTMSYGAGGADVWLIKTSASGETLWSRTFGGTNADYGISVQQTTEGGYVIAGYTGSFGAGAAGVYLIKTDSLGNVGVAEPLTGQPLRPTRFLVQPNPFTSFARVPGHETEIFALSDVTGRQVATCRGNRIGEGLRPGVYFLSPIVKSGNAAAATIIKTAR